MRNKMSGSATQVSAFLLFVLLFPFIFSTTYAATSCDVQTGISFIGMEWVALDCIPERNGVKA